MNGKVLLRLLGQPLVQFALIGAVIFAIYRLTSGEEAAAPTEIRVGATELRWLHDTWQGQFGRPPDATEMAAAVKSYVGEEMRYREGLALGLDRDDTIVRRRLAQKYDFMLGAEAIAAAPRPEQLRAVYDRHPQRYMAPVHTSFCQVYFGTGMAGMAQARRAMVLPPAAGHDAASIAKGAGQLPFPRCYANAVPADIRHDLGAFFVEALDRLPPGSWQGPVESGYGFHDVFVSARIPARRLAFAEARDSVEADWRRQAGADAQAREERNLQARYQVSIDQRALRAMTAQGGR